ncbi:S-adenosyl-L-methionine-dependent methyltransferase [Mycena latifolia]|nr:S-adenosyl-L-methionine-dependent methyltransferase [Mycena latifolia]
MRPDYTKFSAEDISKMEEMSGASAKDMLVQSGLLPTPPKNTVMLDNACGGGVVTKLLFDATSDVRVVCGDIEEHMVRSVAARIKVNGWNAEATVVDAQAIPFPDNYFTHTLMSMGIQLIPDKALAIKESFRVLQSGGKLGMTVGTEPGWLESFKLGVPGFVEPPMFTAGPLGSKESITSLLSAAGFIAIDVQPMSYENAHSMSGYMGSMKKAFAQILVGETAEKYEAYMRERYGDGDFTLTSKMFVITAEKP